MIRNPGQRALEEADIRETPRALFDVLDSEFHFTVDVAATPRNALCERYYTEQDNGLIQRWTKERVWCNPPFTELLAWTDKAWFEQDDAELIVMLVPANRTDQPWWQKNVAPYVREPSFEIIWRAERDRFTVDGGKPILNAKGKLGSPSFACALLIWRNT